MTALELRLILYGLLLLTIVGGSAWCGYRVTSRHYQALIAADRAAQDKALQDAQRSVIAAQQAQQQATQQAEKQYADLKSSYDGLSQRLADSVRALSALRPLTVSTTATTASQPDAASSGAGGDRRLAELSGSAAQACYQDAAKLTALQTWARGLSLY